MKQTGKKTLQVGVLLSLCALAANGATVQALTTEQKNDIVNAVIEELKKDDSKIGETLAYEIRNNEAYGNAISSRITYYPEIAKAIGDKLTEANLTRQYMGINPGFTPKLTKKFNDPTFTNKDNEGAVESHTIAIGTKAFSYSTFGISLGNEAVSGPERNSSGVVVGGDAVAIGNRAWALGDKTVAIGSASRAGLKSIAIGINAQASFDDNGQGSGLDKSYHIDPKTGAPILKGTNGSNLNFSSVAIGNQARALGNISMAFGLNATASGKYAITAGYESKAGGIDSIALGNRANASGDGAIAIGGKNDSDVSAARAYSKYSIAIGQKAVAGHESHVDEDYSSVAIGKYARAQYKQGVAIGDSAGVQGNKGIAIGVWALANSTDAISIGRETNNNSTEGVTIGKGAKIEMNNQKSTAFGSGALVKQFSNNAVAFGVGALVDEKATDALAIGTGATILEGTKRGIAIGSGARNKGDDSVVIGTNTYAEWYDSVAIGNGAQTTQSGAVAIGSGSKTTVSSGDRGYDPVRGSVYNLSLKGKVWESTKAPVSIGDVDGNITRRILSVAAGRNDTDAVNVAQLKRLAEAPVSFGQVNSADSYVPQVGSLPLARLKFEFEEEMTVKPQGDVKKPTAMRIGVDGNKLDIKTNPTINRINRELQYEYSPRISGNTRRINDLENTAVTRLVVGTDKTAWNDGITLTKNNNRLDIIGDDDVITTEVAGRTVKVSVNDTKLQTKITNNTTVQKNKTDIAGNTTKITQNTSALKALAPRVETNETSIEDLRTNKANTNLGNITDDGKTVVRSLAQEAVKVADGTNTTVETATEGNATVYKVNVADDLIKDKAQDAVKVQAADGENNLTVDTVKDDTTNTTTYKLALGNKVTFGEGDKQITIDGTTGKASFGGGNVAIDGAAQTLTVGTDAGKQIKLDGTKGTIGGLTNKAWNPDAITSGQAATEDQLKLVDEKIANIGGDVTNKANTNLGNIDAAGETVVRNLAKESVKVADGTNTTVETATEGNATVYKVNVADDLIKDKAQDAVKVQAADGENNLTVDTVKDDTTNTTTYKLALGNKVTFGEGDKQITIDGTTGKASFGGGNVAIDGAAQTLTVGTDAGKQIKLDGATGAAKFGKVAINSETGTVGGLTNTTWTKGQNPVSGQAATEDQLQALGDLKADKDGSNLEEDDITSWRNKLGGGTITANDAGLVTGGTVHTALATKADKGLSNITDDGKTVVRNLAQDAVKVAAGTNTTVTTETTEDGKTITYKVNVTDDTVKTIVAGDLNKKANKNADNLDAGDITNWQTKLGGGTIADGNTGLVTGGTVYNYVNPIDTRVKALEKGWTLSAGGGTKQVTAGTTVTVAGDDYITAKVDGTNLNLTFNEQKVTDAITAATAGKADKTYVDAQLGKKADTNYVNQELAKKADETYVNNTVNTAVANKADKNAGNLTADDVKSWQTKLGDGKNEEGNTGLITGDTLYKAIKDIDVTSQIANKADTNLTNITDEGKQNIRKEARQAVKVVRKPGSSENIVVEAKLDNVNDKDEYQISLKDDIKVDSVTAKAYKVGDKTYIDDKGLNANGQTITNVAAGVKETDAVNVAQLNAVRKDIGSQSQAIRALTDESREGDALSGALAALKPLDFDPLQRSQIMAGVSTYKGKQAVALGLAHYSNEDTLVHGGISYAGSSDLMANLGISWRFGDKDDRDTRKDRAERMPQYADGPISSVYVLQDEMAALQERNNAQAEKLAAQDRTIADQSAQIEELQAQIRAIMSRLG